MHAMVLSLCLTRRPAELSFGASYPTQCPDTVTPNPALVTLIVLVPNPVPNLSIAPFTHDACDGVVALPDQPVAVPAAKLSAGLQGGKADGGQGALCCCACASWWQLSARGCDELRAGQGWAGVLWHRAVEAAEATAAAAAARAAGAGAAAVAVVS
jgi:hypothetical protein